MTKKRINIYMTEQLHNEMKDYLVDATEFKTISEMINTLVRRYLDTSDVVEENNVEQLEMDIKATNRNTRLLLQQMTTLLKKQEAVPVEHYKDSYYFKKSVDLLDEEFRNKKMNTSNKEINKNDDKQKDHMFKNIYG